MTEETNQNFEYRSSTPGWVTVALVILAVAALAGIGMAYNATTQTQTVQQAMEGKTKTIQTSQQDLTTQLTALQQHQAQADSANAALQSDLNVVTKRLRLTQSDLKKAREEAAQIKTESEQKIADLDASEKTDLATKASTDDVKTVDGRVTSVRTDLDTTTNDLKMARSELGTLIARNHEDIDTLRRLGERDYVEFTIDGKNKPQKVGGIMVDLRGTNAGKKTFNVSLTVDDVRIDKKNLPENEPVFFHQGNDRRPLELVVNTVSKDKVIGYISIPKAIVAQTTASN
jgi:hypothetical protein